MENQMNQKKLCWNIINAIDCICQTIHDSQLLINETKKYSLSIKHFIDTYQLSQIQIWILCLECNFFLNGKWSSAIDDIASYLNVPVFKILKWKPEIVKLEELGFLYRKDADYHPRNNFIITLYTNTLFIQNNKIIDEIDFLNYFSQLYEDRKYKCKTTIDINNQLSQYENNYKHLDMIIRVNSVISESKNRFILYSIAHDVFVGGSSGLYETLSDLYDEKELYEIAKIMFEGKHELFQKDLLEFVEKNTLSDSTITLTYKAINLIFGEKAVLFQKNISVNNLIYADSIISKKLFYSKTNQKEINRITNSLQDNMFQKIQQRLKDDGLPIGVSVLLYGAPGTGKTESVMQIAKATNRPIIHVDLSEARDSKYGESEKRVKKIFTNYKEVCDIAKKKCENIPILLFNEADSLITKRMKPEYSCSDVNNAILDILLEELEKLEGIFIATTNVALNMDSAFERRFLFKIKFENPSTEAKTSIWMNKLSWLNEKDASEFAREYDFSGGQIDNIVRKIAMDEVITGEHPSISEIHEMCRLEKIKNNECTNKLGFCI